MTRALAMTYAICIAYGIGYWLGLRAECTTKCNIEQATVNAAVAADALESCSEALDQCFFTAAAWQAIASNARSDEPALCVMRRER